MNINPYTPLKMSLYYSLYLAQQDKGTKCKEFHSEEKIKRNQIRKLPDVLLIKYNQFNSSGEKVLDQDINCGNSISLHYIGTSNDVHNVHYDLKGVIVHTGNSIVKGQYISLTWNSLSGSWDVTPKARHTSKSELIKQAYVLLFERKQEQEHEEQNHQEEQEHEEHEEQNQQEEQENEEQNQPEQQEHQEQQYSILMVERFAEGLPCMQQLLSLHNYSNICYSNAGTNLLLSSPHITRFWADLPDTEEPLNILR